MLCPCQVWEKKTHSLSLLFFIIWKRFKGQKSVINDLVTWNKSRPVYVNDIRQDWFQTESDDFGDDFKRHVAKAYRTEIGNESCFFFFFLDQTYVSGIKKARITLIVKNIKQNRNIKFNKISAFVIEKSRQRRVPVILAGASKPTHQQSLEKCMVSSISCSSLELH